MSPRLGRKDWALLLISSAGRPVSPLQLQKGLFLLGQDLPGLVPEDYYKFRPYDYGPFSAQIYRDAEDLASESLLFIGQASGKSWQEFTPTERGRARAETAKDQLPEAVQEYVANLINWIQSQTFSSLLRAIYARYPHYKVNSVFRG